MASDTLSWNKEGGSGVRLQPSPGCAARAQKQDQLIQPVSSQPFNLLLGKRMVVEAKEENREKEAVTAVGGSHPGQ